MRMCTLARVRSECTIRRLWLRVASRSCRCCGGCSPPTPTHISKRSVGESAATRRVESSRSLRVSAESEA
eukprot:2476655-Pyramimonas_sp.AAC.1